MLAKVVASQQSEAMKLRRVDKSRTLSVCMLEPRATPDKK